MATEKGIVTRVDSTTAWVKTMIDAACSSCDAKHFCDAHKVEDREVEALNFAGAQKGDEVVIDCHTSSLLKISFLLYVFPILCMILGAVIGQNISSFFYFGEIPSSLIFGFSFFIIAVLFVKNKGNKLTQKSEYRPKIIKIIRRQK
ncbi:MAG TPA: SoxR reducing system RseC family protein [Desulfobacterales bacterium]|nr:SoxR reducing system RseC family protein [Desulfobacterales bacterium]